MWARWFAGLDVYNVVDARAARRKMICEAQTEDLFHLRVQLVGYELLQFLVSHLGLLVLLYILVEIVL